MKKCPTCKNPLDSGKVHYCSQCGAPLVSWAQESEALGEKQIGRYTVLRHLATGGMGEVFLAHDPVCGRVVALKQIRTDLASHDRLLYRFTQESRLTAKLAHPSIIPIYSMHSEERLIYYTMPYVEGENFKRQLLRAFRADRKGEEVTGICASIPALIRVFLSICQAAAYAHKQGVLHRDLKLENVILGPYGEVMILDWGLAQLIGAPEEDLPEIERKPGLTRPGKVVGTIGYMSPERALGAPATIKSDIYALGVILYQLLTLRMPFRRAAKLDEFRKEVMNEEWVCPSEVAPYRDVPRMLAQITHRCMRVNPEERYDSVGALIYDIRNYLEGRSEWFLMAELDPKQKEDWEFREHVLLPEHSAVTWSIRAPHWLHMMVSRGSFVGNVRLEARVKIGESGKGIGLLLKVPENALRNKLNQGYSLWMGADEAGTSLKRSGMEVQHLPELQLERNKWHTIVLESVDNEVKLSIDGKEELVYICHSPLHGTHVGIIAKDGDYQMDPLQVSIGSLQVEVSCLAIPDAFLAHKDYPKALEEYRRIANSFPGRAEGREALFRSGITLMEKGDNEKALQEFELLAKTPGAPLEYLGKSLVYQHNHDPANELNTLELGYRRFQKHPLAQRLRDQMLFRMHDTSQGDRLSCYRLMLMATQLLKQEQLTPAAVNLISQVESGMDPLPWITPVVNSREQLILLLATWLARPYSIMELLEAKDLDPVIISNAAKSLTELGESELASEYPIIEDESTRWQQLDEAIDAARWDEGLNSESLPHKIWSALALGKTELAEELLHSYPEEMLHQENHPAHFLYGCLLTSLRKDHLASAHFLSVLETARPRTWSLLSHYIAGHLGKEWEKTAFAWEKRQLKRQRALYALCCKDPQEANLLREASQRENCYN